MEKWSKKAQFIFQGYVTSGSGRDSFQTCMFVICVWCQVITRRTAIISQFSGSVKRDQESGSVGLRLAQDAAGIGFSGPGEMRAMDVLRARRSYSILLFPLSAQSVSAGKRVL